MRYAIGWLVVLFIATVANAQPAPMPLPSPDAPTSDAPQYVVIPPAGSLSPDNSQPLAPSPNPIMEPPWCESPYRNSAWRIELSVIPTITDVSEFAFGEWEDTGTVAGRLSLGYEGCDGYGTRLAFWGLSQESDTSIGDVELDASTFYWDFYKRFFIDRAELVLGGGMAGANMRYDLKDFGDRATFSGGGISILGELYYPFLRFERTDIGTIARGRIALMSGKWDDRGTPFLSDINHDVMSVMELGWGLELRHRFGKFQDKYWYFNIVPEFQRWDSNSLPDELDPSFEGTNFAFGLAW